MNISEACDVQALLDFVTRLTVWEAEVEPDEGSRLRGAVERLADRSQARLGAGIDGAQAVAACRANSILP